MVDRSIHISNILSDYEHYYFIRMTQLLLRNSEKRVPFKQIGQTHGSYFPSSKDGLCK